MIIFVVYVKQSTAKKQWNLFYDQRDRKDFTEEKYVKKKKSWKDNYGNRSGSSGGFFSSCYRISTQQYV